MRIAFVALLVPSLALADIAKEPPAPPLSSGAAPVATRPSRPMPPPPAPPTPPAEIGKLGKANAGTYKCKGAMMRGDGSSAPLVATMTAKLDLDNAWIQTTFVEDSKTSPLKFTDFRSYDAVAKQWTKIQLVNTTGHTLSTSLGEQNGKWTWEGSASGMGGTLQVREYEQRDPKSVKLWGEAMLGGTWQKLYEVACAK